jgi:hypothetical protein
MFNQAQNRDKILHLDMCLQENNELVKDIINEATRRIPVSSVSSSHIPFNRFTDAFNYA